MRLLRTILPGKQRQRGAVFIVMLVFMIMGVAAFLVSSLNSSALQIKRDAVTANALAQAKEALISRAVADPNSPGSLPCPDIDSTGLNVANDGVADMLTGSHQCPSYIGRLPWKTLGLPDLRDGSGERLWYALSPNFRDYYPSNPINSNSVGTLLIYDNTGTNLLTPPGSEAVAIIFSPGDIVASQQRDAANQNLVQNYLDIGPNSINNATQGGPFISANKTTSFNDRLMIIKVSDIIPIVEMRVAKDLTTAFANYVGHYGEYPHPANFATCTSISATCSSDTSQCIGKIPDADLALFMPAYFTPNKWFNVIYYTAGTNSLSGGTGSAGHGSSGSGRAGRWVGGGGNGSGGSATGSGTGCYAPTLSIAGASVNALFLMPGTPLSGITRTDMSSSPNNLPSYLENAENQNLDDLYVLPSTGSNDSIHILP